MKCDICHRFYKRTYCDFCKREKRWGRKKFNYMHGFSLRVIRDLKSINIEIDKDELNQVRNGGGLFLYGMTGSGKTLYAAKMIMESLHISFVEQIKPHTHRLISVPYWLDLIRKSYETNEVYEDGLTKIDFLVLDDLGVQKETDWSVEKLYQLINYRYENLLPTIFTSNLAGEELANKIGDRIPSRIMQMCVLKKMKEIDYRLK